MFKTLKFLEKAHFLPWGLHTSPYLITSNANILIIITETDTLSSRLELRFNVRLGAEFAFYLTQITNTVNLDMQLCVCNDTSSFGTTNSKSPCNMQFPLDFKFNKNYTPLFFTRYSQQPPNFAGQSMWLKNYKKDWDQNLENDLHFLIHFFF